MKANSVAAAVVLLISLVSFQLFAQGYTTMDTVYTPAGYPEGPLQATIYLPTVSNGIGVVLAHWWTGTRQTPHAWCEAFAANGYVAMSIDYYDYNSPVNVRYPKPVRAYKTGVQFLRRNAGRFGISTGKIVGFGQSEGCNHWAEAITEDNDDRFLGIDSTVNDRVDAAVLMYGIYDNERFLQSVVDVNGLLSNYFVDYPSFRATKGNCIANFLDIRCPVLLFHGLADDVVQFQQALELRDSMAAHHMNVELVSDNGWGHGFDLSDPNNSFTTQGLVARDSVLAFLRRELQPLTTSVSEPVTVPHQFSLSQNYPNPFNPSTSIQYTVGGTRGQGSGSSKTRLVVYDLLGREVATLVNEVQAPGSYEVRFDASGLASGMYLYRLTAGSFTQSRRMLVMK